MCKARALLDCKLPRRERPLLAGKHLTATYCLYGLSHVCHPAFESGTQSRKKIMISSHILAFRNHEDFDPWSFTLTLCHYLEYNILSLVKLNTDK